MAPVSGAPSARRDSGCAEQWESRDPLPIAPCHAGRRAHHGVAGTAYCVSSQTIGCQTAVTFVSARPAPISCLMLDPAGETQNAPPAVCGAGGACRTAPIRWSMAMRYGASPRNPDPAPLCPASSDRYPLVLADITSVVVCCFRSLGRAMRISRPASIHLACIPVPIAPTGARQLAANRLAPACRGRANRG